MAIRHSNNDDMNLSWILLQECFVTFCRSFNSVPTVLWVSYEIYGTPEYQDVINIIREAEDINYIKIPFALHRGLGKRLIMLSDGINELDYQLT